MTRTRTARPRKAQQKVRPALAGFSAASKSSYSTLLLGDIRKFVVAEAIRSGDAEREKHLVHVSEIVKKTWCPRESYYKLSHEEPTDIKESVHYRMETIFANGHDTHHKWQQWLNKMGELWGTWECLACGHVWVDTSPKACPNVMDYGGDLENCGVRNPKYREVELSNENLHIVGHADGANARLKALVEVKSFSTGTVRIDDPDLVKKATVKTEDGKQIVDESVLWKSIRRPLRSHLLQGLFYLWLCRESGYEFDKMIFIYEWKANQDTKEFVVPLAMRMIQPLLDKMSEVIEAVEAGDLPDRPRGFEKDRTPCKDCVFRTTCWERDDDKGESDQPIRTRRRGTRGQASAGEAADRTARTTPRTASRSTRRPDRVGRQRADAADDTADQVGRVHGDTTRVRRGGRAVRRSSDGQGTGTVVTRRRKKRDGAESAGVRE